MFRYFPTNYVWNLSVDLAIEMGAHIGEIEEMCVPLLEASKQPDAEGTRAFLASWVAVADKLCSLAEEDEERVEIPYGGAHIAGLYVRAQGTAQGTGAAPILVQFNGLDSTKEMKYFVGLPRWLAQRGVASLVIDQPGSGEALRWGAPR